MFVRAARRPLVDCVERPRAVRRELLQASGIPSEVPPLREAGNCCTDHVLIMLRFVDVQQPPRSPDNLRNVRVRALLSQRALAQKAGVSPSTIALLEAGRPAPTPVLQTMRRICTAL